jgi:hypothetical protein
MNPADEWQGAEASGHTHIAPPAGVTTHFVPRPQQMPAAVAEVRQTRSLWQQTPSDVISVPGGQTQVVPSVEATSPSGQHTRWTAPPLVTLITFLLGQHTWLPFASVAQVVSSWQHSGAPVEVNPHGTL